MEKYEYIKTTFPGPVKVGGAQVDSRKLNDSSVKSELVAKGLVEQFAAMADFDFDGSPNQFPSGKRRYDGMSKIVDYVPSTFPVSRQQAMVNFRGKIIAHNFATTRQLSIHNEVALTKFLSVLERSVSDKSVAVLDALAPSDTYNLFEHFCRELKVSPFRVGYGEI